MLPSPHVSAPAGIQRLLDAHASMRCLESTFFYSYYSLIEHLPSAVCLRLFYLYYNSISLYFEV